MAGGTSKRRLTHHEWAQRQRTAMIVLLVVAVGLLTAGMISVHTTQDTVAVGVADLRATGALSAMADASDAEPRLRAWMERMAERASPEVLEKLELSLARTEEHVEHLLAAVDHGFARAARDMADELDQ